MEKTPQGATETVMEDQNVEVKKLYLRPGGLFCSPEPYIVTTVLGSCVSICLWDPDLKIGGVNHYMLPLWNGEGLPSPRYGNIAITKLIDRILKLGARKSKLKAKVFGGASFYQGTSVINISERNIDLATHMLKEAGITVVAVDTGGDRGRKIIFNSQTGMVKLKRLSRVIQEERKIAGP